MAEKFKKELAKLVGPLIKGALQTQLGLGWEEKQQTEVYIDQVNNPLDEGGAVN